MSNMNAEVFVNVTPQETRLALLEGGMVQEVFIQRAEKRGILGNIYKGKIQRVLPGMQAAFIDVGLARTAFLHASDVRCPAHLQLDVEQEPDIRQLLREGDEILVQVLKEPLGTKGARLTTEITIPSRYLVFLPYSTDTLGVSSRIEDEVERARLKKILGDLVSQLNLNGGFIVRTAGEGVDSPALRDDLDFLMKLWQSIQHTGLRAKAGDLVHGDLPLVMRILRDLLGTQAKSVRIDNPESVERVREFAHEFFPDSVEKIKHYDGNVPIFDLNNIEQDIARALERRVPLKSGGYLVFDQTEAMTTIDVNTGSFVGARNLEETIFRTNLEATQAIARQLRLRNLGGIIILDFIDMHDDEHQRQVLRALEKALAQDRARTVVFPFSALGLVEMTRKRTRPSLEQTLCQPCTTCGGTGMMKTAETICYEIYREIIRSARQYADIRELRVLAASDVVALFLEEQSPFLAELEAHLKKPIRLQAEQGYALDNFDVVMV